MPSVLIECKNLTKNYLADDKLIPAVTDINLTVEQKDFVIILGHSGSGKTTLLSLIGGLTKPDSGHVFINTTENWQQSDNGLSVMRNSTIGFIFQFASLIPTLSAIENLTLPLSFGKKPSGSRQEALALLEQVGLADKANAFPSQLSGGQQRRIAIARAFINHPAIILADEPTGDLDEETELEILQLFRNYNERGTTFLVVTHNTNLPQSQNNPRVMHMKNGAMLEQP